MTHEFIRSAQKIMRRDFSLVPLKTMMAVAALTVLLGGGAAKATTYVDFVISGDIDPTITFTVPLSPVPDQNYGSTAFVILPVSGTLNGSAYVFAEARFGLMPSNGYSFYLTSNASLGLIEYAGAQLFSGDVFSPTFTTGVYTGQINLLNSSNDTVSITLHADAAPSPIPGAGLLSYLIVGFGSLAAFRKKILAQTTSWIALARLRLQALGRLRRRKAAAVVTA